MALCKCTLILLTLVAFVNASCNDPQEENLQIQWMKSLENTCHHSSFLLAKPFLLLSQNRSNFYTKPQFQCPGSSGCSPLDDTSCTECVPAVQLELGDRGSPSTNPHDDIRLRSVCPWTYMITTNIKMRYPSQLIEAACVCEASGPCPCFQGSADSSCEAVDVPIPILVNTREADHEGLCMFEPKMYRLKIGCTCAKKPVAH